ncbi:beta-glucanase (GH16 family) [Kineosphaera limosa]|uniref:Putative glycoside hydrolase n=1 Tax=Kineosphaera limosa NBRC 100340 TaxID=1184609 RepID=K6X5H3_9MICO|nr:glycoside hydrolase family 16 protein [Kineosphaera limosa]NYE02200.1 beta-glucanase (GH16 family) [Kineosphaera limosa]GAB94054.1 putative glycoside hydrolase [Kineosphaera limosa NBRC 100340]
MPQQPRRRPRHSRPLTPATRRIAVLGGGLAFVLLLVVGLALWGGRPDGTPPDAAPSPTPTAEPTPSGAITAPGPLAFADDFDGAGLDPNRWTDQRGSEPHTYGSPFNPRLENTFFLARQVEVADGTLALQAEPEQVRDNLGGARYDYVSGVVHTGNHFAYTYGYAEARLQVPSEPGYWPAFWMLPTPVDKGWPPEIDIAEFSKVVGSAGRPTFNVHWRDAAGQHQQAGSTAYGHEGQNYGGTWHTYGLAWEPGRLQVFLDGQPGPVYTGPGVPDQPMYIVLGMGVVRGENPAPAAMKIDYVRVWTDTAGAG